MSDMLQRVGAAILDAESQWTPKSTVSKERAMALAALEAMRAPTDRMLTVGLAYANWPKVGSHDDLMRSVWRAMIDAASIPPPLTHPNGEGR